MFRTGDGTLIFPDGTVEFIGRWDSQIKLRGQRRRDRRIEATEPASLGKNQTAIVVDEPRSQGARAWWPTVALQVWTLRQSQPVAQRRLGADVVKPCVRRWLQSSPTTWCPP